MEESVLSKIICDLFDVKAIKFGKFMMKSGIETPIYFDLRVVVSYPYVMKNVADVMWQKIEETKISHDLICGVPYTALPIATCISVNKNVPMVLRRKENKSYGTKQLIEGNYKARQKCLIIEDVVTSGSSVVETANILRSVGLEISDCIVLLDREQGGKINLERERIKLHSIYTMSTMLSLLHKHNKIDKSNLDLIEKFVEDHKNLKIISEPFKTKSIMSYSNRAKLCKNPITKKLLQIMEEKQTNLCLAVDVTSFSDLLHFAEEVGSEICILKTHIDIIEDFNVDSMKKLKEISQRKNFLLFEDRKFADIGNTVQLQYKSGIYTIAEWADLVTIHHLPGPGIIRALKNITVNQKNGCLIVAEMSSAGSYTTKEYATEAINLAKEYSDFVVGVISQSVLTSDPNVLHLTPGVKMSEGTDNLDQKYVTPDIAIKERGADVVIVGRGITEAKNIRETASAYRRASYGFYQELLINGEKE
ncbi:uridine 5'-monophosphate synthase [Centruroides vittatus]|uniref:uridine 5'-monophosphate synthase n=1 Tax=Centruroides vittatus TaxID=120091 RepID=UPI00350FF97E